MTFLPLTRGGNCSILVSDDETRVRKYLRNTSTNERIQRYKRELTVCNSLKDLKIANIVNIYDVHVDTDIKKSYIEMEKYDGNLEVIIPFTIGNVNKTFELILPLIKALKLLSEKESPIYHRDIKPENILYKHDGSKYELYLADFGCCYLDDDRLTNEGISVGSRNYMAPEYEIGKVETVDEKGDIFSIGKIIWHMINGVKNDIFPSNFWYIPEYNLDLKFPDFKNMAIANTIISQCLKINPNERCNYDILIKSLENVINGNIKFNDQNIAKVNEYQEKMNVEMQEKFANNLEFVKSFCNMFLDTLEEINIKYNNFTITKQVYEKLKASYEKINAGITEKIKRNTSHCISILSYDRIVISFNYDPNSGNNKYCKIRLHYSINGGTKIEKNAYVSYGANGGIYFSYEDRNTLMSKQVIANFIEDLIKDCISN